MNRDDPSFVPLFVHQPVYDRIKEERPDLLHLVELVKIIPVHYGVKIAPNIK